MYSKISRSMEDSAWKEIIDLFFQPFMEFFFPVKVAGLKILDFNFRKVKILDYASKRVELAKMSNIFGLVVLAQLSAIETKNKRNRLSRLDQK